MKKFGASTCCYLICNGACACAIGVDGTHTILAFAGAPCTLAAAITLNAAISHFRAKTPSITT